MVETLIIGLDAADWSIVENLRSQGELPAIGEILSCGAGGPLTSTIPPMTPAAWTSIATGVNPGKHGMFDFLEVQDDPTRIVPTDYTQNAYPELWRLFDHFELDVGVLNFPLVYPPSDAAQFFVSGIPASTSDEIAKPESVRDTLNQHEFRLYPRVDPEKGAEDYYDAVGKVTESQCRCALDLLEEYDLDVFMTVFMGLDWIQHYLWDTKIDGRNAVEQFYLEMDDIVSRLNSATGEDSNVVLLSDHGAGPIKGELHLNSWLEKQGYLARQDNSRVLDKVASNLLQYLWTVAVMLPDNVKRVVKQSDHASLLDEVKQRAYVGQYGIEKDIDWDSTAAFSYGYMGKVEMNEGADISLIGADGDTFDEVRRNLISDLQSLTDPETGRSIVSAVKNKVELYEGEMTEKAPDFQLEIDNWEYMVYGDFGDSWFHPPENRIADHRGEGIFAMSGPGVREADRYTLDAVDIAPTLLALHGLPVLREMDGESAAPIIVAEPSSERVALDEIHIDDYETTGHGDEVRNRLEDLGYI